MGILRTPDGTRIKVPDNATPDQVQAIFTAYKDDLTTQARDTEWDAMPWHQKAMVGFAKPFVETGLGIKSLVTDLDSDDKGYLEAGQGVKGVAGTAGEIAGNLATFAAPGAAATRVASALPKAARLAPELAAIAGTEALKAPTEDRTRGQAAMQGVAGGVAGAAAGRVLSKAFTGVKKSEAAKDLIDDVDLTPGMAAEGGVVPWIEQRMAALPFVGGRVANLQDKALRQWNHKTLQSVAPAGAEITSPGREGFDQLQRAFKKSYDAIWDRDIPLTFKPADGWSSYFLQVRDTLPANERAAVMRGLAQATEVLKTSGTRNGKQMETVDDLLRDFAKKSARRGEDSAADFFKHARTILRSAMPDKLVEHLAKVDKQYMRYAVVQKAGTYKKALENGSVFTPSDLLGAVKAKGSDRALAKGNAALQREAEAAAGVFDGLVPNRNKFESTFAGLATGAGLYMEPVAATSGLAAGMTLPNNLMRRIMTGYYEKRPAELAAMLRKYGITSATAGASVNDSSR